MTWFGYFLLGFAPLAVAFVVLINLADRAFVHWDDDWSKVQ